MPAAVKPDQIALPKIAQVQPKAAGSVARVSPRAAEKAGPVVSKTATVSRKNESLPKVLPTQRGLSVGLITPKIKQPNLLTQKKWSNAGFTPTVAVGDDRTVEAIKTDILPSLDTSVTAALDCDSSVPIPTEAVVSPELPAVVAADLPVSLPVEVVPARIVNGNGNVKLIYEQYDEMFPILDGSTTQANIDDVYCLSFVMPDCLIHLSIHNPTVKRELEVNGDVEVFLPESPSGTYQTLEADCTYYVYVEQEADQLLRDQLKMKKVAAQMVGARIQVNPEDRIERDDGRVIESCSCIYGNPCVDEYGCKDWDNRAKVALANGWKGF